MFAILRWPWRQKPLLWISGACLVLVNYGLLRYCSFRAPFHWALWHFVRANIGITWVPYSLVLPSAWGLAFGVLMLYAREASSWGSIRKQWATNQLLEIELMGVIALASSAPSIFLALPGKTLDNFFINTQHWIGIVFLLGFLPIIRERLGAPGNPNAWRASTDLGKSLAGAAVGLILLTAALNAVGQFPGLLDDKRVLIQLSKSAPRRSTGAGMTCAQVLSVLQALDRLPREEKQMSRLYIPTGNRAYWDFFTLGTHRLDAGPFLAPALSGIAQVYGVPANTEIYYGYKIDIPDKSPETLQEVCATVRSQGARWAILFQDAPAQPLSRYDTEKDCL
jgi:hypothetical protein